MNEKTINILHLSDLHFGMEDSDKKPTSFAYRKNALNQLLITLKGLDSSDKPDIVVITGDITWRGTNFGFEQASVWIADLLVHLELSSNNLIICSGNHDINRDKTLGIKPPVNSEESDLWLSVEHIENFSRPFDDFINFTKKLNLPPLNINDKINHLVGYRDIENIRFVVLNSAWFCRGNDDRGKLWIGLPQLQLMNSNQIIKPSDDTILTVALVHHPSAWLHDEEQNTYENRPSSYRYLAERSHLILSGHVHGGIEKAHHVNSSSYLITGGASYAGKNFRNNFSILKLDTSHLKLTRIPFEYEPRDDIWNKKKVEIINLRKNEYERINKKEDAKKKHEIKLFNVPFRQHPYFVGREEYFEKITNFFEIETKEELRYLILTGMGGLGKSQLAVEFSYKFKKKYDIIYWFRSDETGSFITDIKKFNKEISIEDGNNNNVLLLFQKWMSSEKKVRCLFIFDNVQDEEKIMQLLPGDFTGDIIITSLNSNWRKKENTILLKSLDPKESKELVLKSTNFSGEDNEHYAELLSEELGNLPLALEQATAYIRETGITINEYIQRFQNFRKEISEVGKALNYDKNLSTTWKMSLLIIEKESKMCVDFFYSLCFMASEKIPRIWFENNTISPNSKEIKSQIELDIFITKLRSFSLITLKEGHISLHRLVSAITLDHLKAAEKNKWLNFISVFMIKLFDNIKNNPRFDDFTNYFYHLSHVIKYIMENKFFNDNIFELLNSQFQYHVEFSELGNAEFIARYLFDNTKKNYGLEDYRITKALHNLGVIFHMKGSYNEARKAWQTAFKASSDEYEKLQILNNLINVELDSGDIQRSLSYLSEIKNNFKTEISLSDQLIISVSEARIHSIQFNLEKSEAILLDALNTYKINEINNSIIHSNILSSLGLIHQKYGNYDKSTNFYLKSIDINKTIYINNIHFDIARDLSNIGLNYYNSGDVIRAKRYFRRSLRIYEEIYPDANNSKANLFNSLGMIAEEEGDISKALEYYFKALRDFRENFKKDNQDISMVYYNIGGGYHKNLQYDEAETYLLKAIDIDEKIYGINHPEVAKDYGKLAVLKLDMQLYQDSKKLFEKCLMIYKNNNLYNHIDYASGLGHLSSVLYSLGEEKKARELIEKAFEIINKNYPNNKLQMYSIMTAFQKAVVNTHKIEKEASYIENLIQTYMNYIERT